MHYSSNIDQGRTAIDQSRTAKLSVGDKKTPSTTRALHESPTMPHTEESLFKWTGEGRGVHGERPGVRTEGYIRPNDDAHLSNI